jgi:single-strand DNA-binding protein
MFNDINKIVVSGNVGRDIEVKATKSGFMVGKFSLACSRSYKASRDATEYTKKTCWVNVTVLGKYAESLAKRIKKGLYVVVEGRLEIDVVESDGGKKSYTSVVCDNLRIVDSKGSGSSNSGSRDEPIESEFDSAISFGSSDENIPF